MPCQDLFAGPTVESRPLPRARRLAWIGGILSLGACATGPLPQTPLSDPIQIASETRTTPDGPQRWTVARIDLTRLQLSVTPGTGATPYEFVPTTTSAALAASPTARLAINASFYALATPTQPTNRALDSVGLVMAAGQIYSGPETSSRIVTAVLCITPVAVTIEAAPTCSDPSVRDAVAAGPVLLSAGRTPSQTLQSDFATRRHPRSAIALSADAQTAWLVTVDGRQSQSIGATLPELATFLLQLGAHDALNLDGGGSTAIAMRTAEGSVRLLNTPIDGGVVGQERAVATHILVHPVARAISP